MLDTKHFEGNRNITEGSRNGEDLILAEVLNAAETATETVASDLETLATDVGTLTTDLGTLTTDVGDLTTLVGQKKSVFVSALQTGTGAEQDIAHTLVDANNDPVVPSAVFPVMINDATLDVAFVEGVHTTAVIKMTAGLAQTYKVVAIY